MTANAIRCLVCEDEVVIGMDLVATLTDGGIEVVGPFATVRELRSWSNGDEAAIDVAVVDLHLRDGCCREVAVELIERGVPVIVCTGGARDGEDDLKSATWIDKPVDPALLLTLVRRAACGPAHEGGLMAGGHG